MGEVVPGPGERVPTHLKVRGGQCLVLTWNTVVKSGCSTPYSTHPPQKKFRFEHTEFEGPVSQPEGVPEAAKRPELEVGESSAYG